MKKNDIIKTGIAVSLIASSLLFAGGVDQNGSTGNKEKANQPAAASSCGNFDMTSFVLRTFPKRPDVKPLSVKVLAKKDIGVKGWCLYRIQITFDQDGEKKVSVPSNFLINEKKGIGAFSLISLKDGSALSEKVFQKVKGEDLNKAHLVAGNPDAKHSVVVFSDPVCPYCKSTVPKILEFAKKHPNELSVYLYHFPLEAIHPQSPMVSAAILAVDEKLSGKGQSRGDIVKKFYQSELSGKQFSNPEVLSSFIKKEFGIDVSKEEIENKRKEVAKDLSRGNTLGVSGTPTFFYDKKKDEGGRKLFQMMNDKALFH